ncbi:hypothetical protein Glove_362g58 [Diversispora epigaea]|uniref:Uncharacterized protein n=1 Tax=Diversispora epigaea TaxID=1348612 RepID=A0A397H965_9GLOM|nr:hypothetical protein Glove_362g58 [Diversispora epigaea]
MRKSQHVFTLDDHSSFAPYQIRQKLYNISLNLHKYVFDKDVTNVLEEEVERMFTSVDELEKVMHKLNIQMSELDDNNENNGDYTDYTDFTDYSYDTDSAEYTDCECTECADDCTNNCTDCTNYNNHHIYSDRHHHMLIKKYLDNSNSNYNLNLKNINDSDSDITITSSIEDDELNVIGQKVIFFIKEMNENIERLERIMNKFVISDSQIIKK